MTGDAVLLAGSAGTGKTTMGLQYLVNGITQYQENGIYLTFEQLPDQIYRDAANFGWDLKKMEAEGKLRVICTSPDLVVGDDVGGIFDEQIRTVKATRIVIDSLSHIAMYVDEKELRKEAYRLIMYLKTKGLSSICLWETPQLSGQGFSVSEIGMSFLVDCIILLRFVEIESSMRKAITIMKMRGSGHDKSLREFDITSKGVTIAAPFSQYEGIITGSPTRAAQERFADAFLKTAGKGK